MSLGNRTIQRVLDGRVWCKTSVLVDALQQNLRVPNYPLFGSVKDWNEFQDAKTIKGKTVLVVNALQRFIPGVLVASGKLDGHRPCRVYYRVYNWREYQEAIKILPAGFTLLHKLKCEGSIKTIAVIPTVARLGIA